ncbi:conserved hypothetical protein (UCP032285) [Formosa agariphila KMM 3901]|uniref:MepB domain containing protein n=1 Tax=Formosa agariphila (strain DSM 15362 / KCTC 12365 / LMG 23005 / KMM 3901 / M-2Alg 35-1) TaxID=1347342 RepID=T2KH31_FORAG|nr:MepB family protein [Formosa agariphila]CDF78110.1 conserved hypothetical protein (UCP032285) [Formosa agariphila KMM 3901]
MSPTLERIQTKLYGPSGLILSHYENEKEGRIYEACQFYLNEARIICRTAKITPKKIGQFVTFWNRNSVGVTQPFSYADAFDFYVINVAKGEQLGQFVIPKTVGISKGLIATDSKAGKRGFRVYPPWDCPTSNQAKRTQLWQLNYFIPVAEVVDTELVNALYS